MISKEPLRFSTDAQKALAAIGAQIIPASDEFDQPGAEDGADDHEILRDILASGAHLRDRLASALVSLSRSKTVDAAQAAEYRRAPAVSGWIHSVPNDFYCLNRSADVAKLIAKCFSAADAALTRMTSRS